MRRRMIKGFRRFGESCCRNNQLVNIPLVVPRGGLPKGGTASAVTSTKVKGIV